jgi:hypothetical protein
MHVKAYFTSVHLLVHYISANIPLMHRHGTYFASLLIFQNFTKCQTNGQLRCACAGQPDYVFLQNGIFTAAEVKKGFVLNTVNWL